MTTTGWLHLCWPCTTNAPDEADVLRRLGTLGVQHLIDLRWTDGQDAHAYLYGPVNTLDFIRDYATVAGITRAEPTKASADKIFAAGALLPPWNIRTLAYPDPFFDAIRWITFCHEWQRGPQPKRDEVRKFPPWTRRDILKGSNWNRYIAAINTLLTSIALMLLVASNPLHIIEMKGHVALVMTVGGVLNGLVGWWHYLITMEAESRGL
jgi:hypothetical protein